LDAAQLRNDGLVIHHWPPIQAAKQVLPGYNPTTGPAIAIPQQEHLDITSGNYKGTYTDSPEALFDQATATMMEGTNAPPEAFSAISDLWNIQWPSLFP
jgi:hypothetical protein